MTNTIIPFSTARLRISEIDFCGWLGQAGPGDCLEYHRGFLALDGMPMATRLPPKDRTELLKLGRRAMWPVERYCCSRTRGAARTSPIAIPRSS